MTSSRWPNDDGKVAEWGQGLVRLAGRFLPKKVHVVEGSGYEQWALVGPAYIAKATGTLETTFMLFDERRTYDATLLLRSLYENLLVFAWIANAPDANLPRWIKSVAREALKTDDDWRRIDAGLLDHRRERLAILGRQRAGDRHTGLADLVESLRDQLTLDGRRVDLLHAPGGGGRVLDRGELVQHRLGVRVTRPEALEVQHPAPAQLAEGDRRRG